MTTTSRLVKTAVFNAPRDLVWAFLTQKDKLGQWYHPSEADLADGQDYVLGGQVKDGAPGPKIWGRVMEWNAPNRLVTTFCIAPFGENETTVTWELEELAGGTRLTLTHDGIAEAAGEAGLPLLMALDAGWDKHMADLRSSVAA